MAKRKGAKRKSPKKAATRKGPSSNRTGLGVHGADELPAVRVLSYNLRLKDEEGFVGDKASGRAFRALLDELRAQVSEVTGDPLGEKPTKKLKKKKLDEILSNGDSEAAGIIHGAIEKFAGRLAGVVRRYLRQKKWRKVKRIVVGGGIRQSRVGELIIGRASVMLKAERIKVDLLPIRADPDHAGLIGCAHLAPSWLYKGFDGLIAVDIGGSNMRCGIIKLNLARAADLSRATVGHFDLWRYAEEKPNREQTIKHLIQMLRRAVAKAAKSRVKLAPLVAIGCPGEIAGDGSISSGAQNLPGNWESTRFNLPALIKEGLPAVGKHDTAIVMHNDAVVQGLSEAPFMRDVDHWAVLTIGTGLGNASFRNRHD